MTGCDVRGCEREGALTLTRTLPHAGNSFPKIVLLRYCPEHYGAANRFQESRRDRRPVQANA